MKRWWRALWCLLPGAVALGLGVLLRRFPTVTERVFSRGLFRGLSAVLSTLTQYIPASIAEVLVVLALPALAVVVWRFCRARKKRGRAVWATAGRVLGWTLSAVLTLYMLMHGYNYARLPVAEQMGLTSRDASVEELASLCSWLAQQASAAREACGEDADGCMVLAASLPDTLRAGGEGYDALVGQYPFLDGSVNRAKGVRLSHWWSYTGISGVYFPLLAEANVNIDIPDSELPHTIAHELAHTRGFAHEDECNFLGILACISHPSPDWRYSGWLAAYVYTANTLYSCDPERWTAVRRLDCSDGVRRDLRQRTAYWTSFEGQVMEAAGAANSTFIQANGDAEGSARYGEVTRLLLDYWAIA